MIGFALRGKKRQGERWAARALGLVLVTPLWAAPWGAAAARAADEAAGPRLVVEHPELDLGIREPGSKLKFVFRLKNAGTAPLEIVEAKPKCGCIVAGYDDKIPAGGSGTVTAVLDTAGRHGSVTKQVTVYSNDRENPAFMLTLKATLRYAIEVMPGAELLFPIQRGRGEEQVVGLHSFEQAPLKILKVVSAAPFVTAAIDRAQGGKSKPGAQSTSWQALRVRVLPTAPVQPFSVPVTLTTNSKRRPQIVVTVNGYPEGSVVAFPPRLYFDEVPATPEEPVVRPVTLMKKTGAFKLISAESSDPALRLQVLQDPTGRFCEVIVRYEGGWKPGLVKGTLVLNTSDPLRPRLEVPFTAEVGP